MRQLFIFSFILSCTLSVKAQSKDTVNWISFEQLSDSLTHNPKKVILFFHTDWCAYCKKMQREAFTNESVVRIINEEYYAIKLDAESVDTIRFEKQLYSNSSSTKKRGQYHEIVRLLAPRRGQFVFPTTITLDPDFSIRERLFTYLDIKMLLRTLAK